jgi:O-antigen/teichoic acid export membrane protein
MEPVSVAGTPAAIPKSASERYLEADAADIERRTARGGAFTVIYQVGKQAVGVAETAILSRLITPADSGLINMVVIVAGFITLFNDLGLSAATIQRQRLTQPQVSTLFWINVAMGAMLGLVMAALAPVLAWFYNDPRLIWLTATIALGFVFGGVTVQHRALLKRRMRFDTLLWIDTATTIVGTVVTIGLAAMLPPDLRYWALAIGMLVQGPVEIVGLWISCAWRPSRPAWAEDLRPMLAYGGNLTGYRIFNYFARNTDNLLIGRFFGAAALGLYAKAYGLLLLPLRRISQPFSTVALPALSRLNDDPARYRTFYLQMSAIICLLTMPLIAFMIGSADWIIGIVLAPEWAGVATLFALLGISGLIEPFSTTTGWLFMSQGRTREQLYWGFANSALMVGAIVAGMPWGPVGVATAYGVTGLLIRTPLLFWVVGRQGHVGVADLYRGTAPFALTAGTILLALGAYRLWGAVDSHLVNLVAATLIAGVVGLATLAALPDGRAALLMVRNLPALLRSPKEAT